MNEVKTVCSNSFTRTTGGTADNNYNLCVEVVCDNCGHNQSNHYDGSCHKIITCCCHGSKCPCDSFKPRTNYYPTNPFPTFPVYPVYPVDPIGPIY
jgi:hypothetical protein